MKRLDAIEYDKRIEECFPSGYLTLISIIQGAAISLLANELSTKYKICETIKDINNEAIVNMMYIIASLVLIVVIAHEYIWFCGSFRWNPKIRDTAIPLLLGFFEINAVLNFMRPLQWWTWVACVCVTGVFAYLNSGHNCKKICEDDEEVAQNHINVSIRYDLYGAIAGTVLSILFIVAIKLKLSNCTEIMGVVFFVFIALSIVFIGQRMMDELPLKFKGHKNFEE